MQPIHKLIRQIREALAAHGANAPVESLAAEYARLCQEANQRLESCAAMLAKGSEYQALELAETEPVLLDLVAALSFADAPEWVAYCAANQLPWPARFDAKAVQAIDHLYAKGISANHPLYRDYRAAVTLRDDAKAIRIIRSIVRLNPNDANAASELARNENKLFQLKLQELRAALARSDVSAILSDLAELERLAAPERLAELSEYARAVELRRQVARQEAITVAARLVESLDEEREAGAWRMVGDILARLRALQSEHGFALSQHEAARCAEMQRYFDAQRAEADDAARFEHALAELGDAAENVDARLRQRAIRTVAEAQALCDEFGRRRQEVAPWPRPAPDDFLPRVDAIAGSLRARLIRLRRVRRLKVVSSGAAALIAMAAAAWLAFSVLRAEDYASQLARLRDAGQVNAAEKVIAEVRKQHDALTALPKLGARLAEVDHWTRDQRARLAAIESRLAELEPTAKAGLADADPAPFAAKLASVSESIDALADDLRTAPARRLLVLRNQFDAHLKTLREQLIAQTETELATLESLAGAKLGYDQSKETLTQTLATLDPGLKSLEARVAPVLPALELPAAQQARIGALRKRADLFHDQLDALAQVNEAILQATTLDGYLQALAGYKASRLVQAREVNDARQLLASFPKPDALLAGLLLPNDPSGWTAAKADAAGDALAPASVESSEISKLVALRDDPYLNDIWDVTYIDYHRKSAHREFYARGEVKKELQSDVGGVQVTRWSGAIYDPTPDAETPGFVPTSFTSQKLAYGVSGDGEISAQRLNASSECLRHLELNRMTDSTGSKFERPLLSVFDALVHDKTANPLAKAYIMQQLAAILKVRPYAWGLEYCASLRRDLEELSRLCDGAALRSQDWLLERKKAQLGPRLTPFFNGLPNRTYLAEARLGREVVAAASKAGLQYCGFVDSAGLPHLLGEAHGSRALWALGPDGRKLERYRPPAVPPAPGAKPSVPGFSPVFFLPLDREAFLAEAARKTAELASTQTNLPAIPWLETP